MRFRAFGYSHGGLLLIDIKLRHAVVELGLPLTASAALRTDALALAVGAFRLVGLKMRIRSGSEAFSAFAVPAALETRIAGDEH